MSFMTHELGYQKGVQIFEASVNFSFYWVFSVVAFSLYWLLNHKQELEIENRDVPISVMFGLIFVLYAISWFIFPYEPSTLALARELVDGDRMTWLFFVITYLFAIPMTEELCFRGVVMGGLLGVNFTKRKAWNEVVAILISSILFVGLHARYEYLSSFICLFLFSFVVGYARLSSNSLCLPIALHAFSIAVGVGFSLLLI